MKKILVSACLYGHKVRYDGKNKMETNPIFLKWKSEGRLIPFCPEVLGGLPTPRTPSQRVGDKVMTEDGRNVTYELVKGGGEALRLAKENDIAFAILKENSPSCGSNYIYDGTFTGTRTGRPRSSSSFNAGAGMRTACASKPSVRAISSNSSIE